MDAEGLSIDDFRNRLLKQWEKSGLFKRSDTSETKDRMVLTAILREALTDERRLSLGGVGLVKWFVKVPDDLEVPDTMRQPPWDLTDEEAHRLIEYLLDEFRMRRAMGMPRGAGTPAWSDFSSWPQRAYSQGAPSKRKKTSPNGAAPNPRL